MVCNQVGYYQVGPPLGEPAIVSRILEPIYDEVCAQSPLGTVMTLIGGGASRSETMRQHVPAKVFVAAVPVCGRGEYDVRGLGRQRG